MQIVERFVHSNFFVGALNIYLLLMLIYVVYSLIDYFKYNDKYSKKIKGIYDQISEYDKQRLEEEARLKEVYGEYESKDVIIKIDNKLKAVGLIKIGGILNTEMVLIGALAINVILVVSLVVGKICNIFMALGVVAIEIVVCLVIIEIAIAIRVNNVEKQILNLMNCINTYSITTNEVIEILQKSSTKLSGSLRKIIDSCVRYARVDGNTQEALRLAYKQVDSYQFQLLMQSLATVSKYSTEYRDVISTHIDIYKQYIEHKEKIRTMRIGTIIESIVIAIFGVIGMVVVGKSIGTMETIMFKASIGIIIASLCIVAIRLIKQE